jgi:hypothetical protein
VDELHDFVADFWDSPENKRGTVRTKGLNDGGKK